MADHWTQADYYALSRLMGGGDGAPLPWPSPVQPQYRVEGCQYDSRDRGHVSAGEERVYLAACEMKGDLLRWLARGPEGEEVDTAREMVAVLDRCYGTGTVRLVPMGGIDNDQSTRDCGKTK